MIGSQAVLAYADDTGNISTIFGDILWAEGFDLKGIADHKGTFLSMTGQVKMRKNKTKIKKLKKAVRLLEAEFIEASFYIRDDDVISKYDLASSNYQKRLIFAMQRRCVWPYLQMRDNKMSYRSD